MVKYRTERKFKFAFHIHSTVEGSYIRRHTISADSEAQAKKWIETWHLKEFEYIGPRVYVRKNW